MIWSKIASLILKFRIPIAMVLVGVSGFMAWQVQYLQIDYAYSGMLPDSDPVSVQYEEFTEVFGEDGTLFFFGVQDSTFFSIEKYHAFKELQRWILEIEGIENVISVFDAVNLRKDSTDQSLELYRLFPDTLGSQEELDSLVGVFRSLPVYHKLVYNDSTHMYLTAMTMNNEMVNTPERVRIITDMVNKVDQLSERFGLEIHYSGLPYVRTIYAIKIQKELVVFLILTTLVTSLILFFLFRSLRVVLASVLIVVLGVTISLGLIVLLDYRITVLTSMIPPVLIVIGIPNCVFLLNRYHQEYRKHRNKMRALHRVIQKVGNAIFMTNLTTAVGFASFMVIHNEMLFDFGLVASVGILIMFTLSITLIPIFFSFVKPPETRQVKHLDNRVISKLVDTFVYLVQNRRKAIFTGILILVVAAALGITRMKSTGFIVDDLPHNDPLLSDLKFFEKHVVGVMPLEVAIDTRKPNGAFQGAVLTRINEFQEFLAGIPDLSRSFSVVDVLKFGRQAYYGGPEEQYRMPSGTERAILISYLNREVKHSEAVRFFIDSLNQVVRINIRVADVGLNRMFAIQDTIQHRLNETFPADQYKTILTGSSLKFTLGTRYLVENLFVSLGLATLIISIFMAWMFRSFRMVLIVIFSNMIPLLFTAGLMGFSGISVKPSTVLVFSVAFGISVDTAIHYLAKYRQELACPNMPPNQAVIRALREVGVSIVYTVCILFVGFGIFIFSKFGGTVAMGILVSITLLVAVIANLLVVPSLLLRKNQKR